MNVAYFTYTYAKHTMQIQRWKQADFVVQVRMILLSPDFSSSTWGKKHNSYNANHTQCVAHLVMFKISVGRDTKNLNSTLCPHGSNSTFCLHGPISTSQLTLFQNPQILRTISSGHDIIHTPAPFPVWGLLWQWWLSYPLRTSIKLYPMPMRLNS